MTVEVLRQRRIDELVTALRNDQTVIVFVFTAPEMPGWESGIETAHTLLIVDVDSDRVTYHDPALEEGPVQITTEAFLLGWSETDNTCALLFSRRVRG